MWNSTIAAFWVFAISLCCSVARADVIEDCGIPRLLRSALPFLSCPPSTNMEPVLLEMANQRGTVRLKVPRAYVESAESPKDGKLGGSVVLNAFLPDMLPFVLAERAGHKVHGRFINGIELRSEDALWIWLKPYGGIDEKEITYIQQNLLRGPDYANLFETYFQKYQGHANQNSGYFFPLSGERTIIQFTRNPNTSELTGCTLQYSLDSDIWVHASFSGVHLAEYQRIREKVPNLLNSFVVK